MHVDKQQLPGILVGGKFPGVCLQYIILTMNQLIMISPRLSRNCKPAFASSIASLTPRPNSEDAVEHDELDIFLRLKESWNPDIDEDRPPPAVKPVGIPGAATPLQMTPEHLRAKHFGNLTPSASPLRTKAVPVNKRTNELDLGDELGGFGLQGVKVTNDELADLIAQLGLEGDTAGDLMRGLSDLTTAPKVAKEEAKAAVDETKVPIEQPKVAVELEDKPSVTVASEEPKPAVEEAEGAAEKHKVDGDAKAASTEQKEPTDKPESSPSTKAVEEQHKEPISQ